MTFGGYPDAHAVLDAVVAGAQVREELITLALIATGDMTPPNFAERATAERIAPMREAEL